MNLVLLTSYYETLPLYDFIEGASFKVLFLLIELDNLIIWLY
jgi:hypothetical protein